MKTIGMFALAGVLLQAAVQSGGVNGLVVGALLGMAVRLAVEVHRRERRQGQRERPSGGGERAPAPVAELASASEPVPNVVDFAVAAARRGRAI